MILCRTFAHTNHLGVTWHESGRSPESGGTCQGATTVHSAALDFVNGLPRRPAWLQFETHPGLYSSQSISVYYEVEDAQ